jgi:hypothetical protein
MARINDTHSEWHSNALCIAVGFTTTGAVFDLGMLFPMYILTCHN